MRENQSPAWHVADLAVAVIRRRRHHRHVSGHQRQHVSQFVRVVRAVCVDRGHDLGGRRVDAGQNACGNTSVGFMTHEANVGVVGKERFQQFERVVFAAVIDKQNLQIPLPRKLMFQRLHRAMQIGQS